MYCALQPAAEFMAAYNLLLKAVLLIYVPGNLPLSPCFFHCETNVIQEATFSILT